MRGADSRRPFGRFASLRWRSGRELNDDFSGKFALDGLDTEKVRGGLVVTHTHDDDVTGSNRIGKRIGDLDCARFERLRLRRRPIPDGDFQIGR